MAGGKLATYSPEDVNTFVAGVFQISGFKDGSFIEITKETDSFKVEEYPDGSLVRSFTNSRLYLVKLLLASASDSNQVLTRLYEFDQATLLGKFPLFIKDSSGQSLFFAASCWVKSMAQTTYSDEVTAREWEIVAPNATSFVGGNYDQSSPVGDIFNLIAGGST